MSNELLDTLLSSSSQHATTKTHEHKPPSSFSVATYLNLALSSDSQSETKTNDAAEENVEARMAELALQLQMETQNCHDEIETIGMEMSAQLPRAAADVSRLSVGLGGMTQDARALLRGVAPLLEDGGAGGGVTGGVGDGVTNGGVALQNLSTLHALRANLTLTKNILSAASSWDATISSIPILLSPPATSPTDDTDRSPSVTAANLAQAVSALTTLENGNRALRGMPGREDRDGILEDFRRRIEVLLKPRLLAALQTAQGGTSGGKGGELGPLQQCAVMYTSLGRTAVLMEEYVKARPALVHKLWFGFSISESPRKASGAVNSEGFVAWLPGWYDSILKLLAEERRRSLAVFGSEKGPEITARVLDECFRPLLSSFSTRLSTLFSTNDSSSDATGSFESICASYEATLRFLSLAYDQMIGCKNPKLIHVIYARVASPFAPYQRKFSKLELKHDTIVMADVTNDVQSVSQSVQDLDGLQDAVSRLEALAPFVIPVVEGARSRFQLLNCGYQITQTLSTIDKILSDHIAELYIAIGTLSATMTSSTSVITQSFDDLYVQCSLDILKIAGGFVQSLRGFECQTHDQLRSMGVGLRASLAQMAAADDGGTNGGGGGASSASDLNNSVDSLSMVEVGTLLAREVCGGKTREQRQEHLATLQRFAGGDGRAIQQGGNRASSSPELFPHTREELKKLITTCQTFVFDVCSSVPNHWLSPSNMSELKIWRAEDNEEQSSSNNNNDSYSVLPQVYITQVGEHILALVQALEPFTSSPEALMLANEVMEDVKDVAIQPWKDFVVSTGVGGNVTSPIALEEVVSSLINSGSGEVAEWFHDDDDKHPADDDDDEEGEDDGEATFCNEWLGVVGSAVTGRLLERIMRIQKLGKRGGEHLNADLNYILNVLTALGLSDHPHPLLQRIGELAIMDKLELRDVIRASGEGYGDGLGAIIRGAEVRIATLRGVSGY